MTLAIAEPAYARQLTDRIKVAVEGTWELIKEAYVSRAWSVLGYTNWDDYCTREFGTSRLRLPREERQEVVGSLREAGLSIRAIAAATGHDKETVGNDLRQLSGIRTPAPAPEIVDDTSDADPIASIHALPDFPEDDDDEPALTQAECEALDEAGMTDAELARAAEQMEAESRPTITGSDGKSYPATKPKAPNRKAITDSFWTATYDLGKKVDSLTSLAQDDRFTKNADQLREKNLPDLIRARDGLQSVIDQLTV